MEKEQALMELQTRKEMLEKAIDDAKAVEDRINLSIRLDEVEKAIKILGE